MSKSVASKMKIPFIIVLIGSLLLVAMIFLPYASAKDEFKDFLVDNPANEYLEEFGVNTSSAANISMLDLFMLSLKEIEQEPDNAVSIICAVLIVLFAFFALLTLLLSLIKKPVGVMVFDLLTLASFGLLHYDFADRGVLPNFLYEWGIVIYLTYIVGAVVFIGAIWLLAEKKSVKQLKRAQQEPVVEE